MCKVTGQKVKIAGHERKIMTPWVAGAVEESWELHVGNTGLYLGFLSVSKAAHYSYERPGHKQCTGLLSMEDQYGPSLDTESHPRTLLYQIETCRDWLNISVTTGPSVQAPAGRAGRPVRLSSPYTTSFPSQFRTMIAKLWDPSGCR